MSQAIRKKCSSTKSGIKDGFDVSSGCFNFAASKKILGKTFHIKGGKVCPFPGANEDDSDYQDDDSSTTMMSLMKMT